MSTLPPPPPGAAASEGAGASPGSGPSIEHPQATTVLVLGILSIVLCGLLGPVAWKMANDVLVDMSAQPDVTYSNRGSVTAARLCGMIGTGLLAIQVLGGALWLIAWIGLRNGV